MITVKSSEELAIMRKACIITGDVLKFLEDKIKPGVTTKELDRKNLLETETHILHLKATEVIRQRCACR